MHVPFYFACLVTLVAYAILRGEWSERAGAIVLLVGSLLTLAAGSAPVGRFADVETGVLAVDLGVLLAFVVIALKSERYWPIWIAALQLIGVLVHVARLADPTMLRTSYAFLMALWSYPMLGLIAFGTWNHHRRQRKTSGS